MRGEGPIGKHPTSSIASNGYHIPLIVFYLICTGYQTKQIINFVYLTRQTFFFVFKKKIKGETLFCTFLGFVLFMDILVNA